MKTRPVLKIAGLVKVVILFELLLWLGNYVKTSAGNSESGEHDTQTRAGNGRMVEGYHRMLRSHEELAVVGPGPWAKIRHRDMRTTSS